MNKLIIILSATIIFFASCKKDENIMKPYITIYRDADTIDVNQYDTIKLYIDIIDDIRIQEVEITPVENKFIYPEAIFDTIIGQKSCKLTYEYIINAAIYSGEQIIFSTSATDSNGGKSEVITTLVVE